MSDTISRRAVINAHKEYCKKHPNAQWYKWSLSIMQTSPSVDVERNVGRWEQYKNNNAGVDFRCSACRKFHFHNGELRRYKYCPYCGAEMKEDEP